MVTSAIKKNQAEKGNEAGEQIAILLFFLAAPRGMQSFPNQGSDPCPMQWKCRVSTTGPPGKSQIAILNKVARERFTELII